MLEALEVFARKIAWLPGMGWVDTLVNSLYTRVGVFGQMTGDMEVQAAQYKSLATDPFGKGSATGGDAAQEGNDSAGNDAANPTTGAKAIDPVAEAGSEPLGSAKSRGKSNVPPQYRAQRSAMRASCMMFVFLFALVGAVWALFFFDPSNVPWRHSMSWWRIATQVVLVFLIPIVLHRIICLWLEGERSKYPDIDFAWDYGMRALQVTGVDVDSVPLFLLIGSEDDRQEMAIQSATQIDYRAAGVPAGPAALHWYVAPSAIYLYATEIGWTSTLASEAAAIGQNPQSVSGNELPSDAITSGFSAPGDGPGDGTIMASHWQGPSDSTSATPPIGSSALSEEGTLLLDSVDQSLASDAIEATGQPGADGAPAPSPKLSSTQSSAALDRLRYLCQLIRNVRVPLCPLNGIVVLLPHRMMNAADEELGELEKALASDLETIRRNTQLQCPITTMVTGMEKEAGFRELIRRVGQQRSIWQRFGKKFDVETLSSENELRGFSTHVAGAFEDWIYTLFRERESLSKPGNTSLYELLCSVRCSMKSRLERLLVRVFATGENPLFFSGLYFAATGQTSDRQAFVRGVFDKLKDEQELLQWTPEAITEDRRIRWFRLLGILVFLTGFGGLLFLVGDRWWGWYR